jgi:hypothetical protein
MTASALLADLTRRGVRLEVKGERLKWRAPSGQISEADKAAIRTHKPELLHLLRANACPTYDSLLSAESGEGWQYCSCPVAPSYLDEEQGRPETRGRKLMTEQVGRGACPGCGGKMKLQFREPEQWWCAGCKLWLTDGDSSHEQQQFRLG